MKCDSPTLIAKDCEARSFIEKLNKLRAFYCEQTKKYKQAVLSGCIDFPEEPAVDPIVNDSFVCSLNQEEIAKEIQEIKLLFLSIIDQSVIDKVEALEDDLCSLEELVSIFSKELHDYCQSLLRVGIIGDPFPGKTLTSSESAIWEVDGVPVSGDMESSYQVKLQDIGKEITAGNSKVKTVWHPNQYPEVAAFWWSYHGVYNEDGLTLAEDGDLCSKWVDVISGLEVVNSSEATMPTYEEASAIGGPALRFTINDFLNGTSTAVQSIYNGVGYGGMVTGCIDERPNQSPDNHIVAYAGSHPSISVQVQQVAVYTRVSSIARFNARGKKNFLGGAVNAHLIDSFLINKYNCITTQAKFAEGELVLRVNGSFGSDASLGTPENAAASNVPILIGLGIDGLINNVICINDQLSNTEYKKLEDFVSLHNILTE